jgi:predicted enzyme related to lactoylglutathione lyase
MPGTFRHFAINAEDVERARDFYEAVFGWTLKPWGPPDYYQIHGSGDGHIGALQKRRELIGGKKTIGFEATIGVDNLDQAMATVKAKGGRILFPPFHIEHVGDITYFEDPEGNVCGLGQYVPDYWT